MNKRLVSAIAAGLLITGCSSSPETIVVYERVLVGADSRDYIQREETMATTEERTLGAAIHPASLIHVLGKRNDPFDAYLEKRDVLVERIKENKGSDTAGLAKDLDSLAAQSGKDGISDYDLDLWRKYCSEGEGLTRSQILQLHLYGAEVMPKSLVEGCQPPTIEIK